MCPKIRGHRSSDPDNGHSARLPSPSLSPPHIRASILQVKNSPLLVSDRVQAPGWNWASLPYDGPVVGLS